MLARLRGLLRRADLTRTHSEGSLAVADLTMDEDAREVRRGGELIELTATEFELLRFLMRNPRRVLSKAQILDRVWNYDFGGQAHVVELYISYLRKKIDAGRAPLIHTVRGVGYVLKPGSVMTPGRRLPVRRPARPWRSLVRGSLTARLIASLVALVIVTCAVVGVATYTVLRNSLMTNFSQSLQAATQRQISACMNDGDGGGDGWGSQPQAHTSADIDYGPGKSPCNGQVIQGQTAGTFGAWDKDGAITEATIVSGQCHVSAADESTLKGIPVQTLPPLPKGASSRATRRPRCRRSPVTSRRSAATTS